jgi:hypothetical protein
MKIKTLLYVLSISLLAATAHAGMISADFNSGLPAGASLHGNAVIIGGEAQLTASLNSQLGGLSFADQDAGAAVGAWSAEFSFRMDQNAGAGNGADGISLGFSRLGAVGAVGEEGLSSGIAVGFDTYDNGRANQ